MVDKLNRLQLVKLIRNCKKHRPCDICVLPSLINSCNVMLPATAQTCLKDNTQKQDTLIHTHAHTHAQTNTHQHNISCPLRPTTVPFFLID